MSFDRCHIGLGFRRIQHDVIHHIQEFLLSKPDVVTLVQSPNVFLRQGRSHEHLELLGRQQTSLANAETIIGTAFRLNVHGTRLTSLSRLGRNHRPNFHRYSLLIVRSDFFGHPINYSIIYIKMQYLSIILYRHISILFNLL